MTPTEHDAAVVERAVMAFVANATEEECQLPAIQFISNRSDLMAKAVCAALSATRAENAPVAEQFAENAKNSAPDAGEEARARMALQAIIDGDVPRTDGVKWRGDGAYSKNDRCSHGIPMYEDCSECTAAFARAALGPQKGGE